MALISALSAITGDFASSIVKVPREVITARLQTAHYDSLYRASPASSHAWITINAIFRQEGLPGFFRGFWSTTARDWPFMVILFTTYESFKLHHHRIAMPSASPFASHRPLPPAVAVSNANANAVADDLDDSDDVTITTFKSTIFGGISGGLAGYLTTPFDVIRTRIMTHKASSTTPAASNALSMFSIARSIWNAPPATKSSWARSRFSGFFVGATARSVWWFCVCSMFFPIYEAGKESLRSVYTASSIRHSRMDMPAMNM
ncbi:mitochondrial carrier domain-containing protein [Entophlyctis helioformis]|nr:mitochondrial carrier domain-containing protein [Entophlyctis helioformis]